MTYLPIACSLLQRAAIHKSVIYQIFLPPAKAAGELFCPPGLLRSCPTGTFESITLKQKNKAPVAARAHGS